jgi:hypothetical protein
MQEGASSSQGDNKRCVARHQGMPVPISKPTLELHNSAQKPP